MDIKLCSCGKEAQYGKNQCSECEDRDRSLLNETAKQGEELNKFATDSLYEKIKKDQENIEKIDNEENDEIMIRSLKNGKTYKLRQPTEDKKTKAENWINQENDKESNEKNSGKGMSR